MNLDKLSRFPEWEDENYHNNEADEWKSELKNQLAKKLYYQWIEVYLRLAELCNNLKIPTLSVNQEKGFPVSKEQLGRLKEMILEDAAIIPAKISGAEAGDMYVLRMESAAIIRKAANDVYEECASLSATDMADEHALKEIIEEINVFRKYFREWIEKFEKDEFVDEWGLF